MEVEKKKLFEFNNWSRYHFIALAVPIFCMLTTYLQKIELKELENIYDDNIENIYDDNIEDINGNNIGVFLFFFNIFISKILSIIFVLLKKKLSNANSSNTLNRVETKTKRRYHMLVNNKIRKTKTFLLLICISILELIFKYDGYLIFITNNKHYLELKIGFLLIVPFLSVFILKKKFFKHHYLAFGLCIIAFILVCSSVGCYSDNKPESSEQVRHLLFSIPLGLAFVLIKYLYVTSFLDSFSFLFYDGILCIIISIIILGIMSISEGSDFFIRNMKEILYLFDKNVIILFIFVVICSFGYYLTNALTIYIFNPSLMVMTDVLSPIFRWVIELIRGEEDDDNIILIVILKGIGFFIIILSAIIFNEILILHFCGFDKNIEVNLRKRAITELPENLENADFSYCSKDEEENNISMSETELSII